MEGPPSNDFCCVCHCSFNDPVQANCSHWFCGNCIILVWEHGLSFQPCKCPLCRRDITLLVPGETSLRDGHESGVAQLLGKIKTYNRYFGRNANSLVDRFETCLFFSKIGKGTHGSCKNPSTSHKGTRLYFNVSKCSLHTKPYRHSSRRHLGHSSPLGRFCTGSGCFSSCGCHIAPLPLRTILRCHSPYPCSVCLKLSIDIKLP